MSMKGFTVHSSLVRLDCFGSFLVLNYAERTVDLKTAVRLHIIPPLVPTELSIFSQNRFFTLIKRWPFDAFLDD